MKNSLRHYYMHGDDMEKSLTKHGFTKDQSTTDVLYTQYFDHCGTIEKVNDVLVPAFKNLATY
jgi:hypothetical protein